MTKPLWHARIEVPDRSGSGFLADERHVLTCHHVVRGHTEAQVTLSDSEVSRTARVVTDGPWWTPTACDADIAVLELPEPVVVEPARFAPHTSVELYAGQQLAAYGFPRPYARTGVNAGTFTVSPHRLIGVNVQLDGDERGIWLQEGFSGAAAFHAITGRVLGMIKAADKGRERVGVMVPVAQLSRHVPALNDMIELGSLSPAAYTELRAALRPVRLPPEMVGRVLASMRMKVGSMPDHLGTLQAIVEALVVETTTHASDDEMRHQLGGLLLSLSTEELWRWLRAHLSRPPEAHLSRVAYEGAIVVRLEPVAAAGAESYDLTVWTVAGPDGELTEPVVTGSGLRRETWQERVEEAIAEALSRMPVGVGTVTVEFVLPRQFLSEPVDQWIDRSDDDTPLGVAKPVVVRDLDWFNHPNPADLGRRAHTLRDGHTPLGARMRWKGCENAPSNPAAFKAWLRSGDGPIVLGLAGEWAAAEYVGTAVAAGPPVMIWHRWACPPDGHRAGDECAGKRFRRELSVHLGDETIDTVAQRVRRLRAWSVAEEDDTHCGSGITLLRDDNRRRPAPLRFAE